jgi:Flp pilus assembly protein TadG
MDVEDGGAHERRGTQGVQFAAFCLVFTAIVRYLIDTGGAFTASDTKASQMSDVDVSTGSVRSLLRSREARGVEKE